MSVNFGWWNRDPEEGKYQVAVSVHGGNIEWTRKQGHHQPWQPHTPSDEDRERLIHEAGNRIPRRLITQKQFEEIRRLAENTGPGAISGRRNRPPGPE